MAEMTVRIVVQHMVQHTGNGAHLVKGIER
jgi:hypothetical protein